LGEELQKLNPAFASRHAGKRFLGYLEAQRQWLVGERGQRNVNRVELVERFAYDTKYAMHMLRLGHQGVEFLESGRLTLPLRNPVRGHLMDVRQGRSNPANVLAECTPVGIAAWCVTGFFAAPQRTRLKNGRKFRYGYVRRRLGKDN
jgi:RNA repair pathway DNA polymerase beta family